MITRIAILIQISLLCLHTRARSSQLFRALNNKIIRFLTNRWILILGLTSFNEVVIDVDGTWDIDGATTFFIVFNILFFQVLRMHTE